MPIAREGQFLVTRTMGDVPHIGLESAQLHHLADRLGLELGAEVSSCHDAPPTALSHLSEVSGKPGEAQG